MDRKKYRQFRILVGLFVAAIVSLAVSHDSYLLAVVGVLTGMIFMALARSRMRVSVDEREIVIQEKAARMTYAIFSPTIGLAAFFLLLPTKGGLEVFSKGEWLFIESLGMVLAYLTMFMIAIYAISYHFLNRRYGGSGDE